MKNCEIKKNNKKFNYVNKIVLIVVAVVIMVIDIALVISHNRDFSGKENRVLQTAPIMTPGTLTSGRYMSEFEKFVADQIVLRDGWNSCKLGIDKLMGKRDVGNVYLGKRGYLVEKISEIDEENFEKNLEAIVSFADRHTDLNIIMTVVPNAVSICRQNLPNRAPTGDQRDIESRINGKVGDHLKYVDLTEELIKHNSEYIYYKSDHHWTSLGALYAYVALSEVLNVPADNSIYTKYCVTKNFSGTLAASAGALNVKDEIDIYAPPESLKYIVEFVNETVKSATMYNSKALKTNSKYDVFFGGNYGLVRISTSADTNRNILVIKDSYANAFAQFLLPHYSSIIMVDPRYYSGKIDKLITDEQITDILMLHNVNTFVQDNSIAGVLNAE